MRSPIRAVLVLVNNGDLLVLIQAYEGSGDLNEKLFESAAHFRRRMAEESFDLPDGEHASDTDIFGDALRQPRVAGEMLEQGVIVTAFSFPVVPKGAARIRVQLSSAHSAEGLEPCKQAFHTSR